MAAWERQTLHGIFEREWNVSHLQVTFVNATWYNNTALGHGAGLAAQALNLDFTPAATLSCTSCNFTNNTAGGEGGAMFLWNYPYQV